MFNQFSSSKSQTKKSIFFITLGCRLNQAETIMLRNNALKHGFELAESENSSNIVVVNSCSVTDKAQKDTEKILKGLNKEYPEKRIIITGCGAKDEYKIYADIIKNAGKSDLFSFIDGNPSCHSGLDLPSVNAGPGSMQKKNWILNQAQNDKQGRTRLMIKVQDGCNNFCSYCIVPYKRGRELSLSPEQILADLKSAEKQGFKEIVLCGVNIGRYEYEGKKLSNLIQNILKNSTFPRIRLSSINPDDFTEDLVRLWEQNERLCPHFHISLQSGSDTVLARMGRKYNTRQYAELVAMLRENIPDVQITTDIIVGFPGETEKEFAETVEFTKKMQFLKVHVFRYSPREGTRAAKMPDQVPEKTKKDRAVCLQGVESGIRQDILNKYVGKDVEILFEHKKNGLYAGFTPNYIKIIKKSKKDLTNKIVKVRATGQTASGLKVE